jgi:Fe-S-cluster containining protein
METPMDSLPAGRVDADILTAFFDRLRQLFADMDRKYAEASGHYGFLCTGCEDNCCRTRFYHHTYIEYLFVREGFNKLEQPQRQRLQKKAQAVCRQSGAANHSGQPQRLMCPLNDAGQCTLYAYRPMICRLHGIPHELRKPGRPAVHGPGCASFDERCSGRSYYPFDRTPIYFEMADLENAFKQAAGLTGRVKMTIAEMILSIGQSAESIARSVKAECGMNKRA